MRLSFDPSPRFLGQLFRGIRTRKQPFSYYRTLHERQTSDASGFKDEQVSTVQERTLFEQIFSQIMKKDEQKKKAKDLLKPVISSTKDNQNQVPNDSELQIVFEKKKSGSQALKLSRFLEDADTEGDASSIGLARLTTDDIRKYPVSLTSTYFADSGGDSATGTTSEYLDRILSKGTLAKTKASGREISPKTLSRIETKHKLNAKLEEVLKPHMIHLSSCIQTDGDCIEVLENCIKQYHNRDVALEKHTTNTFADIYKATSSNPSQLPQPFDITMPFILRFILTSDSFKFPSDRKYSLISLVYNACKRSSDVSLYLNICNVDFYNMLIEYSWENFQEIHQLKNIVKEMSVNGIMGDLRTVDLLDRIAKSMRYMNDGILEETENCENLQIVGIVWCRENAQDLNYVEIYLKKLKESLT
ncbi:LAQU0S03e06898g1_1 [Lachancea quebecensis]|uniref:LAQU0S03e06898g1_1 n=1 Tax=Lachancea quebecensis TaxID=1654605 RepID=A0A0P1KPD5_9SACH|nr:LAQU0S03e06898g1_1 [Lachancea quebecensis]